jgi:hypothetical protein
VAVVETMGGMFDMTGVVRGPDGIKRYEGLPRNLVQMFRAAVDQDGAAEAVVETGGGPRLSYASLWDRAARVAGGLRGLGVQRGDRVAIRLGNGVDWVLAFLGAVRPGRDLLHQRHHRLPQGCGDQPRELPVQRRDLPPGPVRGSGGPAHPDLGAAVPRDRRSPTAGRRSRPTWWPGWARPSRRRGWVTGSA